MSFSARQQHCLEAMGIVPWVSKSEMPVADVVVPQSETPVATNKSAGVGVATVIESLTAEVVAEPAIAVPGPGPVAGLGPMPEAIDDLRQWLPFQRVGLLSVRTQSQYFVGHLEAPLLVIADSVTPAGSVQAPLSTPFNAEAAQLFDLMMRAINVTLGQRKMCYLSNETNTADAIKAEQVQDLCVAQTKAVLLLTHDWNRLATPVADHFRLDQPPLPVWRIPHPDVLLEFNQLKRQAWSSLQALQSVLS